MGKNKNEKNWFQGSREVNEKRVKKIKIPKNTKNVLKFIASSMPFTIWYFNEPFMS